MRSGRRFWSSWPSSAPTELSAPSRGTVTYSTPGISCQLAGFARAFPTLTEGKRKPLVDSLATEVTVNKKEVAVCLTPPLGSCATMAGTGLSGREYTLQPPEPDAQTVRACALLYGLPAPAFQTAGAACATGHAP
jgi:hypothetical protein